MNSVTQTTAEQLLGIPSDGFCYELVRGVLKKMTPAGFNHGKVVASLTGPLATFVKSHALGAVLGAETGFLIETDPDTVRAPDIAFVRQDRILQAGETDKFWAGAPDLAVEVLSPSDTVFDIEEKVATWLRVGVSIVWVVNPKQETVHVHRPSGPMQTLTSIDFLNGNEVLPGFRYKVSDIFS